jgi:enamine deaminase RidA (YjgF/YER057c/UK114 family)
MIERINPSEVHAPLGGYCHTIKVPAWSELVFVAGQVGTDCEGNIKEGARAQTRQALANLVASLAAHGLTVGEIVRLTVYLTDRAHVPEMREERRAVFGASTLPTSTLLIVSGLAMPELLVEIDAVAARAVDDTAGRTGRTTVGTPSSPGGDVFA